MNINLEDPRLSAYALGEMNNDESKEFEALLEQDAAARAEVEAIRQMAGMLASELQAEPAADMSDEARAKVVAASAGNIVQMPKPRARRFVFGLAKVAAVLLVVGGAVYMLMPQLARSSKAAREATQRMVLSHVQSSSPTQGSATSTSVPPAPTATTEDTRAETRERIEAQKQLPEGDDNVGIKPYRVVQPPRELPAPEVKAEPEPAPAPQPEVKAEPAPAVEPVPEAQPAPAVAPAPSVSVPPAPAPAPESQPPVEAGKPEQMEALKVEAAKPMFVGTPTNLGAPPTATSVPAALPAPAPPSLAAPEVRQQMDSLGYVTAPGSQNVKAVGRIMQWGTVLPPGVAGAPGMPPAPPLTLSYESDNRYSDVMGGRDVYQAYIVPPTRAPGTESYKPIVENEFKMVRNEPLSTFSIDVDTASYANVRRFLNDGQLPPPDAVRIEELINYFKYDYPEPEGHSPFSVTVEANACPWNRDHALALVGLRGRSVPMDERQPINLVFLLDVSGSMEPENKLPLLKKAMRLLVDSLGNRDRVGIVTYASNTGVALESTSGGDKSRILSVLDVLQAGGSTNGAGGIQLAYEMAARNFIRGGVNRIVLATDGDFNVGISDTGTLVQFIEDKAKSGVFLSVLGFGEGNLQDDKLEGLADKGNGNYAYIDSFAEARRVLLDDVAGTMMPIAKDVKIQIEFNPARIGAYRLIGYENRILAAQDFNDDRKDAGEIGSGHTVTALYELVPPDGVAGLGGVDPLKYQQEATEEKVGQPPQKPGAVPDSPELMTVKLRYKQPDGDKSSKYEVPVLASADGHASPNLKFASSVAMFGMLLRGSRFSGCATFDMALAFAEEARGADKTGQRTEFASLVQTARALAGPIHVIAQAEAPTAPGLPPGFNPPAPAPGVPPQFKEARGVENVQAAVVQAAPGVPEQNVVSGSGGFGELQLELPKAMFVGTPKNIVSDNLDPNSGKPRPPLMVPVGTHKLSEGVPVSASDEEPIIGEVEMIIDGDKEGSDGSFVEFGPGVQWVQIDLGQRYEINAIVLWHYHSQARLYHDVIVRVSDDKDFIKYTELFNNDHDNTAKLGIGRDYDYIETNMGRLIDAKGVQARYVRLYSNGNTSNDMNHMVEVEVFGR